MDINADIVYAGNCLVIVDVEDLDLSISVTSLVSGSADIIARNQFSLAPDDPIIGFTVDED